MYGNEVKKIAYVVLDIYSLYVGIRYVCVGGSYPVFNEQKLPKTMGCVPIFISSHTTDNIRHMMKDIDDPLTGVHMQWYLTIV